MTLFCVSLLTLKLYFWLTAWIDQQHSLSIYLCFHFILSQLILLSHRQVRAAEPSSVLWQLSLSLSLIPLSLSCHSLNYHQYSALRSLVSSVPFSKCSYWVFLPLVLCLLSLTDDRQETALNLSTNGISSINMSIEINGVVYTGK